MNLKEQLADLKKELAGLTEMVKSGDDASTKRAKEIVDTEMPALEKKISDAEEKHRILDAIKSSAPVNTDPHDGGQKKAAKSLGEHVAREFSAKKYQAGSKFNFVAPEFKAAGDVNVTPASIAPALTDIDTNIVTGVRRQLTIADLLGTENVSGTALKYFVEGAAEGAPATSTENAKLAQIHFADPTAVTESLKKIGCFYKESDEIISDAAWLKSNIDNRALYLYGIAEEDQLLSGDGTGNNITGIMNRSGIQNGTYAIAGTASDIAEGIFDAITKVQLNSGFAADAVVMNPTDYQTVRLGKDSNGQYYGGGYFGGQYGQGGSALNQQIWGLPTVVTTAMPAGTVLVGAFKIGASVFSKGGVTVEIATTNEDDFTSDCVTIRINRRLGLAVRRPAAFLKLTKAKA